MNLTGFFLQGLKNTLRLNNGKNFSYKGPWVQVLPNTVVDEFYVGDFMAAEYTICVDAGNTDKEIIKCLVCAGPDDASVTVYGRTSINADLITLNATVNTSKVTLLASPIGAENKKLIFSATYYYTINELTST
jgi:hypothetical protein